MDAWAAATSWQLHPTAAGLFVRRFDAGRPLDIVMAAIGSEDMNHLMLLSDLSGDARHLFAVRLSEHPKPDIEGHPATQVLETFDNPGGQVLAGP